MPPAIRRILVTATVSGCCAEAGAAGVPAVRLEEVIVTAQRAELIGELQSASQGTVTRRQIETRPVLRVGELLETVPGLVVTQHSGNGKANQYFLRGFNLDHGTDLATRVDGVPVNMPTHAHGQGYADIGFVMAELIDTIEYRKGPYYAQEGNFSAAGAVDMRYRTDLDGAFLVLEGGEDAFARTTAAHASSPGLGKLLVAGEYSRTDGPWVLDEDARRANALVKYSRGDAEDGLSLTFMGYDAQWTSTDQIPQRAVAGGALDRFGFVDPSDGGESHRYSASGEWNRTSGPWELDAGGYAIDYALDLFSNFTYFVDGENGDQFEQLDDRRVYGAHAAVAREVSFGSARGRFRAGLEVRHDDIDLVGLYLTRARRRIETVREDAVSEASYAAFAEQEIPVTEWLRAVAGLRHDYFRFDVHSDLAANSGQASDRITSPKLSVIAGPWGRTELFMNFGHGYHSNDARGTTITVDPAARETRSDRAAPLAAARGAEVGVRTARLPHTQLAASLWTLELDSELVYIGDGGATEASRASERRGIEIAAYVQPREWLTLDVDLAWTRARFSEPDPAGDRIPGAVDRVVSAGLAVQHHSGWFGGARLRHFGGAPLIEDDSVRSNSANMVNGELGYRFAGGVALSLAGFNLLGSDDNDITYFYESRLAGENEPVADVHFHPVEPRTFRVTLEARW